MARDQNGVRKPVNPLNEDLAKAGDGHGLARELGPLTPAPLRSTGPGAANDAPPPPTPYAAVGGDARVNSVAAGFQGQPAVTFLTDGRYVVVFQTFDGSTGDLWGRLFHGDGSPVGDDFEIKAALDSEQGLPQVAALADGGFVVVWEDTAAGTLDIWGRIYEAGGASTGEIAIAVAGGTTNETTPAVAGLPDGGFVVAWVDVTDPVVDVHARIFQADGSAAGPAFTVNETLPGDQSNAAVAVLADGTIVVVWDDAGTTDVHMRRFASNGVPVAGEVIVNGTALGSQGQPCVAGLAGGGYAIAWIDISAEGADGDIYVRTFDANGDPVGPDALVNTLIAGYQLAPAIAALPDGGFMVSWMDGTPQDYDDIRAQRFDAAGAPIGAEFVVNAETDGYQAAPALAADPGSGTLVVAWADAAAIGGDSDGAIAQRLFTPGGVAPPPPPAPVYLPEGDETLVNGIVAGNQTQPSVAWLANGHYAIVWTSNESPNGDEVRVATFFADGTPASSEYVIGGVNSQNRPIVAATPTGFVVVLQNNGLLPGFDIDAFAFDLNGGIVTAQLLTADTPSDQTSPSIAVFANGNIVVAWTDDATGSSEVRAQTFSSSLLPVSGVISVNSFTTLAQEQQSVTVLANGNFVIVWKDGSGQGGTDTELTSIKMRMFDASGNPIAPTAAAEIQVNSSTASTQEFPVISALASGGFVVVWHDYGTDADPPGIRARIFDADGNAAGLDFAVNVTEIGNQVHPAVAALPASQGGGFLVSWTDNSGGDNDVRAQRFDDGGARVGPEFVVNTTLAGPQDDSAVAIDPVSAMLAVVWTDGSGLNGDSDSAIMSQRFTLGAAPPPPPPPGPSVDLNGADPDIDYAGIFTEGDDGAAIGADIAVTAGALPLTSATITIADAAAGDGLVVDGDLPATITVLSGAGTAELVLAGTGTAADWAAALALVRYTTASDNPDAFGADPERTIDVVVSDGVNTSTPAVATISVAPVNDDPQLANLSGDAVTWTEGDAFVLLDAGGNAAVFDVDSANFAGGSLSFGILTGATAQDLIFVGNTGAVSVSGGNIVVGGIAIGAITSQGGGLPLTVNFNADATPARVQQLVAAVAYSNLGGDSPGAGARSIAYILSDGDGGATGGGVTVTVAAVNDAPVVVASPGTTVYVESVNAAPGATAVNTALTITDADDAALVGATVRVSNNFQAGQDILAFSNTNSTTFGNIAASYDFSIGVLTLTSSGGTATVAQWQAALRAVTYSNISQEPGEATRTIAFTVDDGDAASAAATRLLSVTAQNDSPAGSDANVTINEDAAFTFNAAHFGFSDIDGDAFSGVRFGAAPVGGTIYFDADGAGGAAAVAVTSFPTTTYSAADIAAGRLTFVPTANLNGTGAASVTFTVVDNGGTVGAGQNADLSPNALTFDITPVNDAPSGTDKTINIIEDAAYTVTVADFGFSDVDGHAFESVIVSQPVTGGTLYISGEPLYLASIVSVSLIDAGGLVFVPAANATGALGGFNFTVRDNSGFDNPPWSDPTPNTLSFVASAVNDAPTALITAAPVGGGEMQVNSTALGMQYYPAVAALSGGGYVVTWMSLEQDGSGQGVYMQRYSAAGAPVGNETRVNTTTAGDQESPSVSALSGGGYVVTWQSADPAFTTIDIYAQRYDLSGNALGAETLVNTTTAGSQLYPSVAGLAGGGYVVAWQSPDGGGSGIYVQRYNAAGEAQGAETRVNVNAPNQQDDVAVAGLTGGGYVVVYTSFSEDGSGTGVYAQRYTASGARHGPWARVNTTTAGEQNSAAVAALPGGGYVVTWRSADQDGYGIYAQRFDLNGIALGGETRVNSATAGDQSSPSVAALSGGGYVVTWTSYIENAMEGQVFAQRYDASGVAQGAETLVNTITAGDQSSAAAAGLPGGGFVIAWHSAAGQDGYGVYAQQYGAGAFAATEQAALNLKGTITVADVDAGAGTITVTLSIGYGILTVTAGTSGADVANSGTGTVTITGTLAQIQNLLGGNATSSVTYVPDTDTPPATAELGVIVNDGGNSGSGGSLTASATATINIAAVNDAPSGVDHAINAIEDTPRALSAADFAFTDVENNGLASVTIVTLPGAGTLFYDADGPGGAGAPVAVLAGATFTAAQLGGARLTYVPPQNGSGTGFASFTYSVRDNGGTANGGQDTDTSPNTITINIAPVNDAPTSTGLDNDTAAYTEGDPAGIAWLDVGRDAVIADTDSADFAGGTLTVAIVVNKVASEDRLVLSGDGNGVTISGDEVFVDGVSIGIISADGVGLDRVIALSGGATAAHISRLIQNFSYVNANQANPSTAQRLIEFRLTDGDGGTMSAYTSVTVTAVDDAPVIAGFDQDDVTFIEGSSPIRVDLGGDALVTDVDSMDFAGGYLQVLLQEGVPSEDVVGFATSPETGITLSDGTNTGSIVSIGGIAIGTIVSGSPTPNSFTVNFNANADAADVTALLRAITYLNTNTDNPSLLTRAIVVFVSDGDGGGQASAFSTVHISRVNDAPTSTGFDNVTFTEGAPFAQLDIGFNQLLIDVDSANFDGGTLVFRVIGNKVETEDRLGFLTGGTSFLSVSGNTLLYHDVAFATFSPGGVGLDRTFTFNANATVEAVQTVMRNLAYINANQADPSTAQRTIEYVLTDGDGGTLTLTSLVDVIALNDAPSGTDAAFTINEDATFTFAESHFGFSDPAEGDDFLGVVIASTPSAGTILYDGVAVAAGQFVTLDDIALGKLTFVPAVDANGVPYGSFTFQVRDDGGTGDGGQNTDQSANTLTFNVTAVNDAPTNSVPGATQTAGEDGSVTLSTGNGNAIGVADVDAVTLTVTLSVAHGTLTLASLSGLDFDAGDGSGDASMTFSGSAADINAALSAGLTYNPAANFNGADAISMVATDNGQTGTGAVGTDSDSIAIAVDAVNDAPAGADSVIALDEDGTRILAQADFGHGDPVESNGFAGVVITILPTNGALLLNGLPVTVAGTFVTAAQITAGQLVFQPDADENGTPYATFTFQVRDDGGTAYAGQDTDQSANTLTFNVTAVNDAPVIDLNGAGDGTSETLNHAENGAASSIAPNGTMIDVDTTDFGGGSLLVTIADGINGEDALSILNQGAGAGLIGYANGVVTYEGAAIADLLPSPGALFPVLDIRFRTSGTVSPEAVQALLRAVAYSNLSEDPSTTSRTVTFSLDDGAGSANDPTGEATAIINLASVNDAPSGTDRIVTGSEDDPYVFTAADFGFSDPAEGDDFFAVQIATLPLRGDILLNGAAVMAGDFIAVSAVNAGMLTFQPDPDSFGSPYATFTFRVQDDGGIANGGVDIDASPNTLRIDITTDNLAPVLDLDAGAAGVDSTLVHTENDPATPIAPNATLTDDSADFAGGTVTVRFTANAAAEDRLSILSEGAIAVSASDDTITHGGVLIGSWSGGAGGADLVVQLNANASAAAVEALLSAIAYANVSDDPSVLTRTIEVAVADGDGGASTAQVTIGLAAVDDAAVARNDMFTIDEAGSVAGSVFADHGAGADADVDDPGLTVSAVNGSSANVGMQIQLASGALLRLNADGSFTYATNHAFDSTPTGSSGASNTPAPDSFTYTLAGGGTATVAFAITGLDTDDILLGTAGTDVLAGGNGNNSYRVENASDVVLESVGGGFDGIYVAMALASYTLAAGSQVEILSAILPGSTTAMDLTGNEYGNTIIGSAGVNTLIGGGGADVLAGGLGNDFYRVEDAGDVILEYEGGGFDAIYVAMALGSYALQAGYEIEFLSAILPGSTAGLDLTGNEYANIIHGSAGSNTLIGGGGNDVLAGGLGHDAYRVEDAGDVILEYEGGGFDAVYVAMALGGYTLQAGYDIELLSAIDLASTAGLALTGNEYANIIHGGAGVDTLIGGGGNDILAGGAGNDAYRVEDAGDVVLEYAGGGFDSVYVAMALGSYALAAGSQVELLSAILPGSATAMDLTGNEYGNTLIGSAGVNTLIGGGGNDVMAGGLGNDFYRIEDAGDFILEYAGGGFDAAYVGLALGSYTLNAGAELELLSAIEPTSGAAFDLTGNEYGQTIIGTAGVNILDGKGGGDILVGAGGADIFAFTAMLGAGNVDTISDFVAGTDKIALDDAIFTAIGGTLNANAFTVGAAAADADDRIVYDNATGQLFYDADGNGAGAAVQFATLQGAPVLTASDFQMI